MARCSSGATPTPCPSPPGPRRWRCWSPTTSPCWSATATASRPPLPSGTRSPPPTRDLPPVPGLADGIVVTPSHNPPQDGGFKYNPPNGGPADTTVTNWIASQANALLEAKLDGVRRMPFARALRAATTHRHDYLNAYIEDLDNVIDLDAIRGSSLRLGVDPLGGAGVRYWGRIAERHRLNLSVVDEVVDPTFRFMTVDWDG